MRALRRCFARLEFDGQDSLEQFLRTKRQTRTVPQPLSPAEQRAFAARLQIPAHEYRLTFSRSSGPGGQHVNKTSSKASLAFAFRRSALLNAETKDNIARRLNNQINAAEELLVSRQDFREQNRNAEAALTALKRLIAESYLESREQTLKAHEEPPELRERRVAEKRRRSEHKQNRRPSNERE